MQTRHISRVNGCNSALLLAMGVFFLCAFGECLIVTGQERPALPVVVATIVQRDVVVRQTFVGTVNPLKTSVVGSAVDGRVDKFLVNQGDFVKAGQVLAQLKIVTVSIELSAAKAEQQLRFEELREMENGALPEDISQTLARSRAADALMKFAVSRSERTRKLFQSGRTVSEDEVQEKESAAEAAVQVAVGAKAALELVKKGPRKEQVAQARARLLMQEEQVRRIEDVVQKYTIRAPFDGYVVAEHTEAGEWISRGDPIAEVIQLDPVEINVFVPEIYVAYLRPEMEAVFRVDAVPRRRFTGKITSIVPQADVRSRAFPVIVQAANTKENGQRVLKSGMLARATIPVGAVKQALLAPKDAVVLGAGRRVVYVVDESKKIATVRPVPVTTGVADGALIQISGEIRAGQRVVVQGNERLRAGQKVVISNTVNATPAN